jgi:hypothetical protein
MTTATDGFVDRLQELVGPIVVKEVRQGLRAKVFAIFFAVLLAGCLMTALVAVAAVSEAVGDSTLGRDFLAAYLIGLSAVTCFVIPFTAFRSMLREQEEETWVMLLLTGLGGRNIVRGKWVSAMSQALLFGSAAAPFVVFTYFLNGIDIPQIVVALALLSAWTCLLTAAGIGIATQAHTRVGRTFAHFVALATLGGGTFAAMAFGTVLSLEGTRLMQQDAFLTFCLGLSGFALAATVLVLEGAAAGLALPSEPASAGPRKAMTAIVVGGLTFGVAAFVLNEGDARTAAAGSILTSLFLAACGVFAISERDGFPARFAGTGWLKPGALRSYWLVVGLLVLSTVVWGTLWELAGGRSGSARHLRALLAAPLYSLLYLSAAAFFGRVTVLRKAGEPLASRIAFGMTVLLGSVVPPIIAMLGGGRGNDMAVNSLNPVVGMVNHVERSGHDIDGALVFLGAVTLLFVFLASAVLGSRDGVRSA